MPAAQMKLPPTPRRFAPAGEIIHAAFANEAPAFAKKGRLRGARALGIRYERKVQKHLLDAFPDYYIPSPWLSFVDGRGNHRICQPDGFFLDIPNGMISVVEVKYQHTTDAWWQLWKLYIPVLRFIFPTFEFRGVEIVRWYDPSVAFPQAALIHDLMRLPYAPQTGVHILKA